MLPVPLATMVVRRQPGSIRGTRVGAGVPRTRPSGSPGDTTPERPNVREPIADPARPREVVDHTFSRRAAIDEWHRTGGIGSDACDAHPDLVRAARWHGEATDRDCPICADERVVELTYVYGKELGAFSGRLHPRHEVRALAMEHGVLRVFVVEVCRACHWNHIVTSYVVGDGIPRRPKRRPNDLEW